MVKGCAATESTKAFAGRWAPVSFGRLGRTGLTVSRAGFGGYRISTGAADHEKALRKAFRSGINLVDTSANYADGGSEALVGQVIRSLTAAGEWERSQVVVVSKVGYLQGENFALSRQRKQAGRPFADLVEVGRGLEHCIHPEFIEDQLTRSLKRLGLETLDGYLLHNPEYYLGWAAKNGLPLDSARKEYDRRIRAAFEHLEAEVEQGRISCYGISSNTFPNDPEDPEFTCLETVWEIAQSITTDHHFALVQLPFNLLETGAVLEDNQPEGTSALRFAAERDLGVLVNRPLNAAAGGRLLRLADLPQTGRMETSAVIEAIRQLGKSEARLWRSILPRMDIPEGLKVRVKQQNEVSDSLKHYWKNFGSYEGFRQAKTGVILPRVQGVFDFLQAHAAADVELRQWLAAHRDRLGHALDAVGSIYVEEALRVLNRVRGAVDEADPEWAAAETLSQKAIRALRSTRGVSSVLVGMRKEPYVEDVLKELGRPVTPADRRESWSRLQEKSYGAVPPTGR